MCHVHMYSVYQIIISKFHSRLKKYFRFSKRYMILCGIWFDKEKPSMYTLLKPILDQINVLYEQGIQLFVSVCVHVLLLTITNKVCLSVT